MKNLLPIVIFLFSTNWVFAQGNIFQAPKNSITITHEEFFTESSNISSKSRTNTQLGFATLGSLTNQLHNTAIGYAALVGESSIAASNTTAAGYLAGFGARGSNNTIFGNAAFSAARHASNSLAIGDSTLIQNNSFTLNDNLAIGNRTLRGNTNGNFNLMVGHDNNSGVAGIRNLVLGHGNMQRNNTGTLNVIIGHDNLNNLTNASANLVLGHENLQTNETGNFNIVLGRGQLNACTNCNNNIVALGALPVATNAQNNIFLGNLAGATALSVENNIAVGDNTLKASNSGNFNIALGGRALENLSTGDDNVALGASALEKLTTGSRNTSIGTFSLREINTSNDNIAVGEEAGNLLQSGNQNIFIGYRANLDVLRSGISNALAIGNEAVVDASNKYVFGNSSVAQIGGFRNWSVVSDRRLKKEITKVDALGLDFIHGLKPVRYIYIHDKNAIPRDGLLAQDVKLLVDKMAPDFDVVDETGTYLSLRYEKLVLPLIGAVQELHAKLEKLKDLNEQIEAENRTIEALLSSNKEERYSER